ncbi:hypothetical protein PTTG_28266 [Puccinia triticina 1-1 BBBD Race 1]|uniref:Uncharacterized protein n=1 Tax=Puccinia triticina (isolate 1-1 / race 1 (BBBD)) TaxID=630390 RepID=A0A180GD46_PUCT1|nr:hypothetical protein PTTG_28266 [Puccinia triticina 1-1 BBBD Race 1]
MVLPATLSALLAQPIPPPAVAPLAPLRGPIPPAAATRVFLPARGPSAPGGRVFSAPRITSTGRVIPPRLVSNPSLTAAASVPVQAAETATALGPSPNQSDSTTPANGARHGVEMARGHDSDKLESLHPKDSSFRTALNTRAPSPARSEIEVLSGPPAGELRSLARKILHSPAGDGIAHTISCLNFGRP